MSLRSRGQKVEILVPLLLDRLAFRRQRPFLASPVRCNLPPRVGGGDNLPRRIGSNAA